MDFVKKFAEEQLQKQSELFPLRHVIIHIRRWAQSVIDDGDKRADRSERSQQRQHATRLEPGLRKRAVVQLRRFQPEPAIVWRSAAAATATAAVGRRRRMGGPGPVIYEPVQPEPEPRTVWRRARPRPIWRDWWTAIQRSSRIGWSRRLCQRRSPEYVVHSPTSFLSLH